MQISASILPYPYRQDMYQQNPMNMLDIRTSAINDQAF